MILNKRYEFSNLFFKKKSQYAQYSDWAENKHHCVHVIFNLFKGFLNYF